MITTRRMTQSAMAAALAALVLFLGHSLQFGEFFWYLLASTFLLVCLVQTGYLGGFIGYIAILALGYVLTADLFFMIPFSILGLIPFIEKFFRSIHFGRFWTFVLGMMVFDASLVATFLVFDNRIMAFIPEAMENLYPTDGHWVLYWVYGVEALLIGIPSYLGYSFGLARATLKLRHLLKSDPRREEKASEREQKRRERKQNRS